MTPAIFSKNPDLQYAWDIWRYCEVWESYGCCVPDAELEKLFTKTIVHTPRGVGSKSGVATCGSGGSL